MEVSSESVFATVQSTLSKLPEGNGSGSIALVTCGLAGSGKTTLAKNVLSRLPGYERLSIDEIVGEQHGLYGKDYAASAEVRTQYEEEADVEFRRRLLARLSEQRNVLLDRSFYAKEDRDEFRNIVEGQGGRWVLVYLRVRPEGKEALWERIVKRAAGERDANSALHISHELFEAYWKGFEGPEGEGEVVIDVL